MIRDEHLFPYYASYSALPAWVADFSIVEAIEHCRRELGELNEYRSTYEGSQNECCAGRDRHDDDFGADGIYNPVDDQIDEYEAILDYLTRRVAV